MCIGSHFALLEAQLALATMVRAARVRVMARDVVPEPLVTLRPRGGMPAIVEAKDSWAQPAAARSDAPRSGNPARDWPAKH